MVVQKPLHLTIPWRTAHEWASLQKGQSLQSHAFISSGNDMGTIKSTREEDVLHLMVTGVTQSPIIETAEAWTCHITTIYPLSNTTCDSTRQESLAESAATITDLMTAPSLSDASSEKMQLEDLPAVCQTSTTFCDNNDEVGDIADMENDGDSLAGTEGESLRENSVVNHHQPDGDEDVAMSCLANTKHQNGTKENHHVCLLCKKVFNKSSGLSSHVRWQHRILWKDYIHAVVTWSDSEARIAYLNSVKADNEGNSKSTHQTNDCNRDKDKVKLTIRCLLCTELFRTVDLMKIHIDSKHEESAQDKTVRQQLEELESKFTTERFGADIPCPICKKVRYGINAMKHHLREWHTNEDMAKLIKTASDIAHMKKQDAHKHKKVACFYCKQTLNGEWSRDHHMRAKCPKNPHQVKWYHCNKCSNKFLTPEALESHKVKQHIPGVKQYKCELCDKAYSGKSGLNLHKRRMHNMEGQKPIAYFKCNQCEKTFYLKENLRSHQVTHTNEKSLQCSKCEKRFRRQQSLKVHERQIHNNLYPHTCPKCGHGVEKKQLLINHKCGRVRRNQQNTKAASKVDDGPSGECDADDGPSGECDADDDQMKIDRRAPVTLNKRAESPHKEGLITGDCKASRNSGLSEITTSVVIEADVSQESTTYSTSAPFTEDGTAIRSISSVTEPSSTRLTPLTAVILGTGQSSDDAEAGWLNLITPSLDHMRHSPYVSTHPLLLSNTESRATVTTTESLDDSNQHFCPHITVNKTLDSTADDNPLVLPATRKMLTQTSNLVHDNYFSIPQDSLFSIGSSASPVSMIDIPQPYVYEHPSLMLSFPEQNPATPYQHTVNLERPEMPNSDPMCGNLVANEFVDTLADMASPISGLQQSHYCDSS